MLKSECLGNPIFVFAWVFYVLRTEPASNFLYSLYRMGFNCQGQGSPYITPGNDSCWSQKPAMPGKCKARNFASALFVQKWLILVVLDSTSFNTNLVLLAIVSFRECLCLETLQHQILIEWQSQAGGCHPNCSHWNPETLVFKRNLKADAI